MANSALTTGDTFNRAFRLQKNSVNFNIDSSTLVSAVFRYQDEAISAPIYLESTTSGADWANSLVIVRAPEGLTAEITKVNIDAVLDIMVDDPDNLTWHTTVRIRQGLLHRPVKLNAATGTFALSGAAATFDVV